MENIIRRPKLEIKGTIEIKTGLHIGGSSTFAAIGDVDSPVIRDVLTELPLIPGSSLKGKIRTLLACQSSKVSSKLPEKPNDDPVEIRKLFGSSEKPVFPSRLIFRDTRLPEEEMDRLRRKGIYSATEIKFENSIKRLTAEATPRQIERVIRGVNFPLSIIYNVLEESEIVNDFKLLAEGFKLLQFDYLGGNGSRGYGEIEFHNFEIKDLMRALNPTVLQECEKELQDIEIKKEG